MFLTGFNNAFVCQSYIVLSKTAGCHFGSVVYEQNKTLTSLTESPQPWTIVVHPDLLRYLLSRIQLLLISSELIKAFV